MVPEALAPGGDLLLSLSRLVRGLSALFWGLPIALVVSVQTARTAWLAGFGLIPPLVANGIVLYGLLQVGRFQPRERVWRQAVERCQVVAWVNCGLSPFLYWLHGMPEVLHYRFCVLAMALSGLLLLLGINRLLDRLSAMLPDETLRLETRLFTQLNRGLLLTTVFVGAAWAIVRALPNLPLVLWLVLELCDGTGLLVLLLLVLLPLALTMALLWRVKETILGSVFAATAQPP